MVKVVRLGTKRFLILSTLGIYIVYGTGHCLTQHGYYVYTPRVSTCSLLLINAALFTLVKTFNIACISAILVSAWI